MSTLLPLSIGIGLVVSLLFTEIFGLAAGGLVVPGYLALQMNNPINVIATIAAGLATFALVHALSTFIIIYGRRRTVLMILVGYIIGMLLRKSNITAALGVDFEVIGYIIPGLIAIWLDRQGVIETISSLITASIVVRLILVMAVGTDLWQ